MKDRRRRKQQQHRYCRQCNLLSESLDQCCTWLFSLSREELLHRKVLSFITPFIVSHSNLMHNEQTLYVIGVDGIKTSGIKWSICANSCKCLRFFFYCRWNWIVSSHYLKCCYSFYVFFPEQFEMQCIELDHPKSWITVQSHWIFSKIHLNIHGSLSLNRFFFRGTKLKRNKFKRE